MKREWRKHEKDVYLPSDKPQLIVMRPLKYLTVKGKGNPNDDFFKDYIEVLYSLSYTVRMSYKWNEPPKDYYDYTVYPLEGVWDIADKSKYVPGIIDKNNLAFDLMIRQPDFLSEELAEDVFVISKKKKPHFLIDSVEYKTIEEGLCVQMMHYGSYDDEPANMIIMEKFCNENGCKRTSMKHREIYLTDPRKTEPEKLKTVLRFKVEEN